MRDEGVPDGSRRGHGAVTWLGRRRVALDVCASTMMEADRLAQAGAEHGTVVTARDQRAGRGRRGRVWSARPGDGLNLSVILRPPLPVGLLPPVTLAAGIAVCDAVNSLGARASLKWPNDVLVGGRKLAGILTEMSSSQGDLDRDHPSATAHVILGIGINVRSVPDAVAELAVSLAEACEGDGGNRAPTVAEVLEVVLGHLEPELDAFFAAGLSHVVPRWRERAHLGRRVRRTSPPLSGRAIDMDDRGALVVEDDAGQRHTIVAGELDWE